ncbi:MAG: hypothetical protein WD225_11630 [Ilumatobacteraceae bacterium]
MLRGALGLVLAVALLGPTGSDLVASGGPDPVDPGEPADPVDPVAPGGTVGSEESWPATARVPGADRQPLVEVPSGCASQPLPDVVFVGRVVDRDYRTARYRIDRVRAGDPAPFAADGLIDVRYGIDVKFLESDEQYLVSARRDPVLGVLASRIRSEPPMFGGDDVVGLDESQIECPDLEDPVRTLHPDGTAVDTNVVGPLFERRAQLAGAVLLPLGVSFGLVFVLASLRVSIAGLFRGMGAAAARARR